jgi:heat shock protein HslJ
MKNLVIIITLFSIWACAKNTEPIKGDLNATWNVTQLAQKDVTVRKATCKITTSEKKVNGTTGCNFYGADITFSEDKQTINFAAAIQTKIGCLTDVAIFEADYMKTLENITQYEFKTETTLLLKDAKNTTLITLQK